MGLSAAHADLTAGELLEMIACGGEALDPDVTPAGEYLGAL